MKISGFLTDDAVLVELGFRVARLRVDTGLTGLTQVELAAGAGVAKRTLERLENGDEVHLSTLIRVLRELGRLDAMEFVIPDADVRPVDMLQRKGRPRKRASRAGAEKFVGNASGTWTWGDEK